MLFLPPLAPLLPSDPTPPAAVVAASVDDVGVLVGAAVGAVVGVADVWPLLGSLFGVELAVFASPSLDSSCVVVGVAVELTPLMVPQLDVCC